MDQEQRRQFVYGNRTCWVAHITKDGTPWATPGYCWVTRDATGRDVMHISTMEDRGKAGAVERGQPVTVSVWDEKWPPTYVAVSGTAEIDRDPARAAQGLIRITGLMAAGKRTWWRRWPVGAGAKVSAARRAQLTELAAKERRVVIDLIIEATFHTPPKHVRRWRSLWDWVKNFWRKSHQMGDIDTLTHSTSKRMPW